MIAVIDSGGANISSIQFALERLGVNAVFTRDPKIIQSAPKVILPGVGAAAEAMRKLQSYGLVETIQNLKQPVLGICLGMQLLFTHSEEGDVNMLELINAPIRKFTKAPNKTIPHMGWNTVETSAHPLLKNIDPQNYFYFVHSYFAPKGPYTIGACTYVDESFSAIIAKDNFMGCQFHPERSSKIGAQLLQNFVEGVF